MYHKRPKMKPSQFRKWKQLQKTVVRERDAITPHRNEIKEELFDSAEQNILVSFRVGPDSDVEDRQGDWDYWYILIGPKGRAAVYASPKRYHQYAGTFIPQMGLHFRRCCKSVKDFA